MGSSLKPLQPYKPRRRNPDAPPPPPAPPKGAPRTSSYSMEQRVATFVRLILRGATRSELQTFAKTNWAGQAGLSTRQVDKIIAKAKVVIHQDWSMDREQFTAEMLGQLGQLAKEARRQQNLGTVLGCYNTMARIVGLGSQPNA